MLDWNAASNKTNASVKCIGTFQSFTVFVRLGKQTCNIDKICHMHMTRESVENLQTVLLRNAK